MVDEAPKQISRARMALCYCVMAGLVIGAQFWLSQRFSPPPAPPLPAWYNKIVAENQPPSL